MASLRPAVEAIYATLGMAPPVDPPGTEFTFDLGGVPIMLRIDASGSRGTIHATLGTLSNAPHTAGEQLGQLLRIGLGLTAINRAALDVPAAQALARGEEPALRQAFAVAHFPLAEPAEAIEAIREVMEWQGYAEAILGPPTGADDMQTEATQASGPEEQFVIFQP